MRTSQLNIRSGLVTRARTSIAALTLAAFGAACLPVEAAQAAPQWCRAWKVGGQTWYGYQSNGYSLLFTVRMAGSTSSLSGYARASRGDVNRGGVSSQYLRGGVVSDGIGRVMIEVQWANGSRGQYHATTYDVRRSASGGLTAGLTGTTVDVSGGGGAARWIADGMTSGIGTSDRYIWPMFCARGDVVRYPR
jgi:hypothetical protein